jgi:hypothetical protein
VIVPRVAGAPTDEDSSVTDPDERLRRFGQPDHVRMYGDDLGDRLASAGFRDQRLISADSFSAEQEERHRLTPHNAGAEDALIICK